jgi:hypothetical protein
MSHAENQAAESKKKEGFSGMPLTRFWESCIIKVSPKKRRGAILKAYMRRGIALIKKGAP